MTPKSKGQQRESPLPRVQTKDVRPALVARHTEHWVVSSSDAIIVNSPFLLSQREGVDKCPLGLANLVQITPTMAGSDDGLDQSERADGSRLGGRMRMRRVGFRV